MEYSSRRRPVAWCSGHPVGLVLIKVLFVSSISGWNGAQYGWNDSTEFWVQSIRKFLFGWGPTENEIWSILIILCTLWPELITHLFRSGMKTTGSLVPCPESFLGLFQSSKTEQGQRGRSSCPCCSARMQSSDLAPLRLHNWLATALIEHRCTQFYLPAVSFDRHGAITSRHAPRPNVYHSFLSSLCLRNASPFSACHCRSSSCFAWLRCRWLAWPHHPSRLAVVGGGARAAIKSSR